MENHGSSASWHHVWLAAAAAALAAAPAGAAPPVTAADPAAVLAATIAAGYPATLGIDTDGDPRIEAKAGTAPFSIIFMDCTGGRACQTLRFIAAWDTPAPPDLALLNRWNRDTRWATAAIDSDDDPQISHDIDLSEGGVSRRLMMAIVNQFATMMVAFEKHIGWAG